MSGPVVPVHGRPVDLQTRCAHWHSELDVVAIEFACCRRFYPCHTCHEETADHPATTWPVTSFDRLAVLCGVCHARTSIAAYLAAGDACEACGAAFNPGCRLHRHLYFASPPEALTPTRGGRHRRRRTKLARMRTRKPGMWWGTAVEAPDPAALARFWSTLLEWPLVHEEPGTAVIGAPPGQIYLVFQQADGYEPPVWPPVDGRQRPMTHFDFQVDDLDDAVAEAVALGATLAEHQPQPHVRVLLDPAGHPFCVCLDDGG